MPYDYSNLDPAPLVQTWISLRMKQSDVSRYSGISDSKISRVVSRQENFSLVEWNKVERLLDNCGEIARRFHGAVDWRNAEVINRFLTDIENERRHPPAPPSAEDIQIHARFVLGDDVGQLSYDYRVSDAEILRRVEAVMKRGETLMRTFSPTDKQLIG